MTVQTKSKIAIFCSLWVLIVKGDLYSNEVLFDRTFDDIRSTVLVSDRPITIADLEKLNSDQKTATLLSVKQIYPSKYVANQVLRGKGSTDLDRSAWSKQYEASIKEPRFDMGEIIQVGQNVLIRVIRSGHFEEKIISGNNPLLCVGELGCEIIWISIGGIPPLKAGVIHRPKIDLYVRTKDLPDTGNAARLASALRKRFDSALLSISFRTDDWFITDSAFPVYYPFRSVLPSIRPGDVNTQKEVLCVSVGEGFHCAPPLR